MVWCAQVIIISAFSLFSFLFPFFFFIYDDVLIGRWRGVAIHKNKKKKKEYYLLARFARGAPSLKPMQGPARPGPARQRRLHRYSLVSRGFFLFLISSFFIFPSAAPTPINNRNTLHYTPIEFSLFFFYPFLLIKLK